MTKTTVQHDFAVGVAPLILMLAGCTSASTTKIQPAPPAAHDRKTPVAMQKSSISQRFTAQRIQDAQAAQGQIAVEGSVVR